MATAEPSAEEEERGRTLHSDSVPLVDLRLLSQSELSSLALSAPAPHSFEDDVVIPKIDRSVFNESAGSRKQTFSRLRLAPRGKQPPAPPPPPTPAPAPAPAPAPYPYSHIPLDEENSQIISLLQTLFGVESLRTSSAAGGISGGVVDGGLVSVQVEFKQPESGALPYQTIPIHVVDDGSTRKRKRGRPRKNESSAALVEIKEVAPPPPKKKAKAKAEEGLVEDDGGVDPIEEEVKRRTVGMETEAQLVELLEGLKGEWVSQRKKRKVVEAGDLGPFLPSGWKVVLSLMKRAGRASIVCRRYVSPYGPEFGSFKEVSAYLLSFYGEDINLLKSNYTDGSLQFLSNTNVASGSHVVGHVPTGGTKTDASASRLHLPSTSVPSHHEKQATVSSSVGNDKLNTSDGNFNSSLAWGCKLGDTSSVAFGDFDCSEDKQPMMDDKNTANSVQGSSFEEDRVHNQKMADSVHAAGNLYIPLVFSNPFPNNNSGIYPLSDEMNPITCIESGISNCTNENKNTGFPETAPCGNRQAHVDNNRYGLSVRLVDDQRQKVGFGSSMVSPNFEGNMLTGSNLQDKHLISSQEDMKISDGNVMYGKQQIISSSDQYGSKDVSTDVILQNSSDGFSLVSSQKGLEHMSINSSDWIQTFLPEDSDITKCFDSDLPIDEGTWVPSDYAHNDSFSTCTKDASEFGGVYIASNLSVVKDVSDNHAPPNEDSAQERNSLNDQNCKMDSLLHTSSKSNLPTPTGDEHPSGNFDALKAVDAGCKMPQLGIFSCSSDVAVDAYTNASIVQGSSQGFESVALAGSVLNQFDMQSNDNVNNANKSCLSEKAKSEQVDILQTNPKECSGNHKALLVYSQFPIKDDSVDKTIGWRQHYFVDRFSRSSGWLLHCRGYFAVLV